MQVDSPDDRKEMPEECDNCGFKSEDLKRFSNYGPGYQVEWLCPYCRHIHSVDNDPGGIKKTMASLFNQLEKILVEKMDAYLAKEFECWYCHRKYGPGHKCSTCGRKGC